MPRDTTALPRPCRNRAAVWSLVLGTAALFLSVFVIGGLLGLIALVLGIIAFFRPSKHAHAIGGIFTGKFAILVVAFLVWMFVTHARENTIAHGSRIAASLADFNTDMGRYPTTDESVTPLLVNSSNDPKWHGPYIAYPDTDVWGRAFIYRCPGIKNPAAFDLVSAGPDGVPDTPDDIEIPVENSKKPATAPAIFSSSTGRSP